MREIAFACLGLLISCSSDGGASGADASAGAPDAATGSADAGTGDGDAATGDADAGSDPVLRAVVPATGHPGRTIDAVVLVENLAVDADMSTLDFGPGIAVDSATVLSATALGVQLTIALDAEIGARDVALTLDDGPLTGTGLFEVVHPLAIEVVAGSPTQGGLVEVTIDNLDTSSFFPDFLFEGGLWLAEEIDRGPSSWRGMVAIDPLAPAMASAGIAQTTSTYEPTLRFTAEPLTVAARAPTAVTFPANLQDELIDAPLATNVYKLSTTQLGYVYVQVQPQRDTIIDPVLSVLPGTGTYQDVLGTDTGDFAIIPVPAAATDLYVVVRDRNFGGGSLQDYGYRIAAGFVTAVQVDEQSMPHATEGTAQAVSFQNIVQGELDADDGQDVYTATLSVQSGASLRTDADLELHVSCSNGTMATFATRRPFERLASFRRPVTGQTASCFLTVRPRPGIIGRPTGTYTLTVF